MTSKTPKTVAVSQRVDVVENRDERRDAIDQRLSEFIISAGYLPVPVPNKLVQITDTLPRWLNATGITHIVLSGGNNVGDTPERDATESALLDYAKDQGLPVLGVCRGMQMMAVWAGGALTPIEGHVRTHHSVSGIISGEVNHYHDYSLKDCPQNFEITAKSDDGVIEAIRHTELPWQGWMWHPERETKFSASDIQRLASLFGD
jgi:putative glutamine amidotransferase